MRHMMCGTSLIMLGYLMISLQDILLNLLDDSLESGLVVHGEVSEDLAVDLDASLVERAHEL